MDHPHPILYDWVHINHSLELPRSSWPLYRSRSFDRRCGYVGGALGYWSGVCGDVAVVGVEVCEDRDEGLVLEYGVLGVVGGSCLVGYDGDEEDDGVIYVVPFVKVVFIYSSTQR